MNSLEKDILVALLDQTRKSQVLRENFRKTVRITDEAFNLIFDRMIEDGSIVEESGAWTVSQKKRIEIAVKAIRAGADLERVSRSLGWLEFEEMVAYTFEENGYEVFRRFRFQADGRRWEIDIIATKKPTVVCAECKQWSKGLGNVTARRIVEKHLEKVKVLSESIIELRKRLAIDGWEQAFLIPITLSLQPARKKIYRRIPVVSIFELPSFLDEFTGQMDWLTYFKVEFPSSNQRFFQTLLRGR